MTKFGRYDSSNKKDHRKGKQHDGFKKIKDSDKGFSRSNDKIFLRVQVEKFKEEDE